jgi:DNA-binding PadR family transcriptional regulator
LQSEILKEMKRTMVTNFLDTIILAELKNSSPLSGYDILDFVYKKFGFLISPGTIYALLYAMERKGLVRGSYSQTKRVYTLTGKGTETIDDIWGSKEEIFRFMRTLFNGW